MVAAAGMAVFLRRFWDRAWAERVLAWGLAAVFVYAAAEKIADPAAFAQAIGNYRLLPPAWVTGLALLLPWWEAGAAAALLLPGWRRTGAWLILGLVGVFMLAIGSALVRGLDINCGCFGTHSHRAGLWALLLDALLAAAAVALLWRKEKGGSEFKVQA
jgi:putative oxidoreductase